jgi:hypothetical protein
MTVQPYESLGTIAVTLLLACVALVAGSQARSRRQQREEFIRSYVFPSSALAGLTQRHPALNEKDQLRVVEALRDFFLVRLRVGDRLIGMPSRVVDDLWHEFILDTREYQQFCKAAFGSFFHHVPASSNPSGEDMGAALRVTWRCACLAEGIYPQQPARLPLLFAIDSELQIANGHSFINRLLPRGRYAGDGGAVAGCGGGGESHGGDHGCGGHGGCGGGCGGH